MSSCLWGESVDELSLLRRGKDRGESSDRRLVQKGWIDGISRAGNRRPGNLKRAERRGVLRGVRQLGKHGVVIR